MDDGSPVDQRLGFGCVRLGSASGDSSWRSDVQLVRAAVDAGVTLFDTADAYGHGASERILGKALRARREDVQIATKVGYRFAERSLLVQSVLQRVGPLLEVARRNARRKDEPGATTTAAYSTQDFTPSYLRQAVEASLRRLDTDYVDVLQLHGPPILMPGLLEQLDDLVRAGKVLRWGVGAESVESACEWIGTPQVGVVQLPFGVLDPEAVDRALPDALANEVELWVRAVFGGGVLADAAAGRITAKREPSANPARHTHPKWPLMQNLLDLAAQLGISPFELAFDYVRSFVGFSTIIVGIHSHDHLEDNLRMLRRPTPSSEFVGQINGILSEWVESHEPS